MSHDTHAHPKENKTIISFKSAFWLVVIIVGLFIAALNFVKVESEGGEEGKTEVKGKLEATTTNPPSAEGENKPVTATPPVAPVKDTAAKSAK